MFNLSPSLTLLIFYGNNYSSYLDVKSSNSKEESYFFKFMKSLLALFSSDKVMQEERWAFIIRLVFLLICFSLAIWNEVVIFYFFLNFIVM